MILEKTVYEFLKARYQGLQPEIKYRPLDNTIILCVLESQLSERAAPNRITERQLSKIENELAEEFDAEVVVIRSKTEENLLFELAIQNKILTMFQEHVLNVFTKYVGETIEITIVANTDSEVVQQSIGDLLRIFFSEEGYRLDWQIKEIELPSPANLLAKIKIKQPIKIETLFECLKAEYEDVSESWLKNSVDMLRKKGLIIRNQNGAFAITYQALEALPVTYNKNSLDIKRALELGGRSW